VRMPHRESWTTLGLGDRVLALAGDSMARNSAMIASASLVTSALGYAYWVAAARLYTTEAVGAASAVISVMALVSTVAILGGQSLLVQRLPHRAEGPAWSATLTATMLLGGVASAVGALVLLAVAPVSGTGSGLLAAPELAALFVVAVVATTVSTLCDFAWVAERRSGVMLATNALFAVGKLALLVVLAAVTDGLGGLLLSWTATCVLATTVSLALLRRLKGHRLVLRGCVGEMRVVLRSLAGHHVINLAIVAPTLIMPVIAATRLSLEDSAYLYAAWRIGTFFVLVASATGSALFAEGAHDPEGYGARSRRTLRLLGLGFVAGMILLIALRGPILGLFGPEYRQEASTALLLLVFAAPAEAAVVLGCAVLRVRRQLLVAATVTVAVAVLELGTAWLLMPQHGLTVGAWAALVCQTLGGVVILLVLRLRHPAPSRVHDPHSATLVNAQGDAVSDRTIDLEQVAPLRVLAPALRRDLDPAGPTVTVVVPAMNEARNLPWLAARMPRGVAEIVLVDGRSVDDTVAVARELWPAVRVITQNRRGKGNAMACGFAAASGAITVMIDADGSMDPGEIPLFVDALVGGADYAKGSRFRAGGGSSDITRLRRVGNYGLNALTNAVHGTRYTDLCYGYNAFWTRVRDRMRLDPGTPADSSEDRRWGDGFEIETLLNVRVHTAGLRITEVSSFEHRRLHGASNLNAVRDGLRVLRTIAFERRAERAIAEHQPIPAQVHAAAAVKDIETEAFEQALKLERALPRPRPVPGHLANVVADIAPRAAEARGTTVPEPATEAARTGAADAVVLPPVRLP